MNEERPENIVDRRDQVLWARYLSKLFVCIKLSL